MYLATKLGIQAKRDGKQLRHNPYIPQLKEHRQWRQGWFAEHNRQALEVTSERVR